MREKAIINLQDLQTNGFIEAKLVDGKEIYRLITPSRITIAESIVQSLKEKYLRTEEIGGIFWVKPTILRGEVVFLIDRISYLRNAIADKPRTDSRNKSNAYLPDEKELETTLNELFNSNHLPIRFHSHPLEDLKSIQALAYSDFQSETSEQDRIVSKTPYDLGGKKLLMPRGLVLVDNIGQDIFIGIYNGLVAPEGFDETKKRVREENFKKVSEGIADIKLSSSQKFGLGVAAIFAVFLLIRYWKVAVPVMLGGFAAIIPVMTTTRNLEKPHFFNKISKGPANIYLPKAD